MGDSSEIKRVQVPLGQKQRQKIEAIAEQEKRTVPTQSALIMELGLAAIQEGYVLREGGLVKVQLQAAS